MKKIWIHTLVRNEEKFIWYSIMSVINYIDKIFIWDTGSTDKTVQIIEKIVQKNPGKIIFKEVGNVDPEGITSARQEMLEKTNSDWLLILDGDEIWWNESIEEIVDIINSNKNFDLLVSPVKMLLGDIYHYQDERKGRYQIAKKSGHLNIRAIKRTIPGLHLEGVYPQEAYINKDCLKIQEFPVERIGFTEKGYLHASYLRRQINKRESYRFELGKSLPFDYYYPEAFFQSRPDIVPCPWSRRPAGYFLKSLVYEPLRCMKIYVETRNES